MSEETLKNISHHASVAGLQQSRVARVNPEDAYARPNAIPLLVRRLSAPLVRAVDQVVLTGALFLTLFSFSFQQGQSLQTFLQIRVSARNLAIEVGLLCVWRFIFWMAGLYQPRLNRSFATFFWKIPMTALFCTALVVPLLHLTHQPNDLVTSGLLFWFISSVLMLSSRIAVFTYEERIRPAFRRRRSVLICGTGVRARMLAMQLPQHPDFRYQLAGFIDSAPQPDCNPLGQILGGVDDLENILMRLPVDEVMVALPVKSHFQEIEDIIGICGRAGIQVQYSLELFTTEVAKHQTIDSTHGGNRVVLEMVQQDHRLILKSTFDRIVATLGLLLLSPVFLAVAVAIKLTSPGPIFFVQQRFGMGKRKFGMIKFRSMVIDAEARQAALEHLNEHSGPTFKIKSDPRITSIGNFLRKSSLDELPQLINVVKGDMSLVGPRPLPSRDVERFSEAWLMRRFSVKPGITGLWQVSGRANTDFDNTIKLDLRYIDRWSLLLDIKILFRTFAAVLKGRGAY